MTPQDARKLLGGYATGTLTTAEREALFAAALEDQELFDELAREQALRDLLADPAAKGSLLAALDAPRRRWWQSWHPWAAVAAMAAIGVLAVSLRRPPAAPVQVARVEPERPKVLMSAPAEENRATKDAAPPVREKVARQKPAPLPEAEPEKPAAEMAKNEAKAVGGVIGGAPPPAAAQPSPAAPPAVDAREQVQVTAASPRLAFQDAAASALRVQAQPLSLRYVVLREDGAVRIRFTAAVPGYLSVGGATPVALVVMQPYTSAALSGDEVKVVFGRQPQADAPIGLPPNVEQRGGETYVNSTASSEPLVFTIPLKQP